MIDSYRFKIGKLNVILEFFGVYEDNKKAIPYANVILDEKVITNMRCNPFPNKDSKICYKALEREAERLLISKNYIYPRA